jgi:predicted ATPase
MPRAPRRGFGSGPFILGLEQLQPGQDGQDRLGALPAVPRPVLGDTYAPMLAATRPRDGYFLRAESFFNLAASIDGGGTFAPDLSLYGGVPLHEQSHGQSFLALAANRFGRDGLYILDAPEAPPLSTGAIALLLIVVRAASAGAQFVTATHSPVPLACPGARIYELGDGGVTETVYDDLKAVQLTRAFLEAPERFLRSALADGR